MCACLTFAFVVVGTFITRSGVVQSVHAFEGDPVSLMLFGGLIVVAVLVGLIGLAIRWKAFASDDAIESMASKAAAYYFNNVIMIVFTFVLCYLTVASALPTFLPFGGQSLSAGTYDAIARPLGILYCFIIAVCPLLAWTKTDRKEFSRLAKVPAICAVVLFVVLLAYFVTTLYPAYDAIIQAGSAQGASQAAVTAAEELMSEGPVWYYNGLAVVGFAVASLLFFNTLFMIARAASKRAKATGKNPVAAFFGMLGSNSSKYGGYIAHFAMAIILVGLIGSSMFVTEKTDYVAFDEEADTAENFVIDDYELRYTGSDVETMPQRRRHFVSRRVRRVRREHGCLYRTCEPVGSAGGFHAADQAQRERDQLPDRRSFRRVSRRERCGRLFHGRAREPAGELCMGWLCSSDARYGHRFVRPSQRRRSCLGLEEGIPWRRRRRRVG